MADPTYGIKLTFYMNPHTSRVMKKSALVMVLSLLATPAMADPWYGRELGSDSQEAKISCRSWPMGWGTFRASEISLAEGIYRIIRNESDDIVFVSSNDCRVIVTPSRSLTDTIKTK